ncbi:MAG: hypothetical protein E7058_06640 [Lentisphaerae bacterium]|nr:hypothetical protein [Lentisphaerota bacterium]
MLRNRPCYQEEFFVMSSLPETGEIFSGCQILAQCGKGAYGVVFLARNPLGQKVIIKIVTSPKGSERELKGLRNYMAVSGKHPNLLHIFHIGELDDGFYYIMEAADNCNDDANSYLPATLGNLFRLKTAFSLTRAVEITKELLGGLKVMHDAQLIHRDIKPDNIIFVNGKAKLSDPGLVAEVGKTTSLAGTIGFIPPEVVNEGANIDQHADLYAVGKVFYCMVTGNSPGQYPHLPIDMQVAVCRQIHPALIRMCNRNRSKRFRSADEFIHGLPENITPPTWLDKIRENFRNWRICNRELWRFFLFSVIVLIIIAAALTAIFFHRHHRQQIARRTAAEKAQQTTAAQLESVSSFNTLIGKRRELLKLQIQSYLPEKFARFQENFAAFDAALKQNDPARSARLAQSLREFLGSCALSLIPALPQETGDFTGGIGASGAMHGFLSTPLAAFLSDSKRNALQQKLADFDRKLYRGWGGFTSGKNRTTIQEYYLPVIFVPPGAVKMSHSGEVVKIPYSFWIGKHEVLHENFTLSLGIAPQKSPHPNTPVERVAWNDALFYCYILTMRFHHAGILPPGYIVRMPTEAEWEFAAKNAWMGADETPLSEMAVTRENSLDRTSRPGSKSANSLGLWDIYGNVAEMVSPIHPTAMQNSVVVRGGSFKSAVSRCDRRFEYLKYQFMPDDIGFRVVIAPGTPDYFDDQFFLYGAMQTRYNGNIYELVGANSGAFTWRDADMLSRLTGGKLAEFDQISDIGTLRKKLPLLGAWPTFIGGIRRNGTWLWQSSGKPVDPSYWQENPAGQAGNYLTLNGSSWRAVSDYKSAIFLCQWDEKEYAARNRYWQDNPSKVPGIMHHFIYGKRRYLLIDSSMLWYGAARFCELLGGHLASLDTPELQKYAAAQLAKFPRERILLGGYAKRDKWYWLSGKEITLPLAKDDYNPIPSCNRNFVTLQNGKFCNSQFSSSLLCELEISSDSSH